MSNFDFIPENKNLWVPYYLMSCYLYYEKDKNVLSDGNFDKLCKLLLENWDDISHINKDLISKEALQAGSGYDIIYTNRIKNAGEQWYKDSLAVKEKKSKKKAKKSKKSLFDL